MPPEPGPPGNGVPAGGRRELVFRFAGRSMSPLYAALAELSSLSATFEPTSIRPDGVGTLATVRGPPADVERFAAVLQDAGSKEPDRLRMLLHEPGVLVFFDYCPTPSDGSTQLEQVALDCLGEPFTYRSTIHRGVRQVTVVAPAEAPLERLFSEARERLAPRFNVRLVRLGPPEPSTLPRELDPADERVLLLALREGFFDLSRGASVRDLANAVGRSKTATNEALRRGVALLVSLHLDWSRRPRAQPPDPRYAPTVFEFWGAVPKSPHYAHILASPGLSATVESLNVSEDAVWQVIAVDGPDSEIESLGGLLAKPPPPPIVALTVLERIPGRIVYFDKWRRPSESEGVSIEHLLWDRCGSAGTLKLTIRNHTLRVRVYAPVERLDAFLDDAFLALGKRFSLERLPSSADTTPKEEADLRVLAAAWELGWFGFPRTASLAAVGARLGLSASSVGTALRRAVRRAVVLHVQGAARALERERSGRLESS